MALGVAPGLSRLPARKTIPGMRREKGLGPGQRLGSGRMSQCRRPWVTLCCVTAGQKVPEPPAPGHPTARRFQSPPALWHSSGCSALSAPWKGFSSGARAQLPCWGRAVFQPSKPSSSGAHPLWPQICPGEDRSSRHLQLYSQPRERAHARQENTEVFLQSICSSWLPPRQETETVKEEDWNFSLMCWLVRGAAAVGARVFGSRGPAGTAGLGLQGNPRCWLGCCQGIPPCPSRVGAPAAALSSPWGRGGTGAVGQQLELLGWFSERVAQGLWGCWGNSRPPSPQAPGEQNPLSPPAPSRAATLPGAGTWGQAAPWSATSVSPPYLLTPFLTPLLVQVSVQRVLGHPGAGTCHCPAPGILAKGW
ncbi:uncharacterized protein LOC121345822 [Onychostruthus taczanowskii]|uniref:uncharacterized protein LOC121345822 n=1 Tax=Onychostruthus taczanowskii TaxID=356909 RepID=UPI001B80DBA7|nr:uncharacterized protein LOC121345822 [Onychostruthus taczanowskii]